MSSKILLGVVAVVIVALLGVYFSGKEKAFAPTTDTTAQTSETATVPAKDSSSDVIVDYLVDGLSSDAEMTAKASIDSATVPSQSGAGNSLNTNF